MKKNIFILMVMLCLLSCDNPKQVNADKVMPKTEIYESLEENNRLFLIQESEQIDDYIERNELKVIQTGTGLRYQIINQGEGELIKKGDIVTLEYELFLLNGNLIYSSENEGYKTFLVGRGGVESGLEEAILKLKKNSSAILILPSHLAHGLIGDGGKIPSRAALLYKIKVIDKR